jgi:predicted DNA-binding protein
MKKMKHSTVRINKEIKGNLEELAKHESRSLANMITVLVNRAYEEMKK